MPVFIYLKVAHNGKKQEHHQRLFLNFWKTVYLTTFIMCGETLGKCSLLTHVILIESDINLNWIF